MGGRLIRPFSAWVLVSLAELKIVLWWGQVALSRQYLLLRGYTVRTSYAWLLWDQLSFWCLAILAPSAQKRHVVAH
jgi:hypothetical protein